MIDMEREDLVMGTIVTLKLKRARNGGGRYLGVTLGGKRWLALPESTDVGPGDEIVASFTGGSESGDWAFYKGIQLLSVNGTEQPKRASGVEGSMPAIVTLFETASQGAKRLPKIQLKLESGQVLRLAIAGARSKNPGVINLTDGRPFGQNVWFGRIEKDGSLNASRSMTEEVAEFLTSMNGDPSGVAAERGKALDSCIFCMHALSDEKDGSSLDRGYGPVCAARWGLPHG